MLNYTLKYRRFDQLLDEVMLDFSNYSLENFIEPHNMIKIAKQCNYNLGIRINMTKETVLEVEKGRVRLPYDFFTFNYGLLCGEFSIISTLPQGTQTWEEPFPRPTEFNPVIDTCSDGTICPTCTLPKSGCSCGTVHDNCNICTLPKASCNCSCNTCHQPRRLCGCPASVQFPNIPPFNPLIPYGDYCVKPRVFMNCKGQAFELIQIVSTEVRQYKRLIPLKLSANSQDINCECPNLRWRCRDEVWIKDGWLYANFECGRVYINYQGMLQDDDGNLLVLDHDAINPYYEYSMKKRILENLWINGEDVANKLSYIDGELVKARMTAMAVAKMPNFQELQNYWSLNRRAQWSKWYQMFQSYQWDIWDPSYPYAYTGYPLIP